MLAVTYLLILLGGSFVPPQPQNPPDICGTVADCQAQALAARAAGDYEHFHDLAWRAVQKGKPNDPQLMYLLARAQSLSGRPDDARVMLGRLADLGVIPDAETNPDFARVRALSDWPELDARLRAMGPPTLSAGPGGAASAPTPAPSKGTGATTLSSEPPAVTTSAPATSPAPAAAIPKATAPKATAPKASAPKVPAPKASASATPAPDASSAKSPAPETSPPVPAPDFDPSSIAPIGLAHDAVSRRFVIGDRHAARLVIVDELSHHVVTLVSADVGFYDRISGFTIDTHRGDLWVTSTRAGDAVASRLHKLQLVSGRVLEQIEAPQSVALAGVAVSPDGTVYGVDGTGGRLLRLRPGATTLDAVMPIPGGQLIGIAAAGDRELYVATSAGIVRVDPVARTAVAIKSRVPLTSIQALAWAPGALVAVQHRETGTVVVLLRLDPAGLRTSSVRVLAPAVDDSPVTVEPGRVYFLSGPGVIGHVALK